MKRWRPAWLATILICAVLAALAERGVGEDNLADGWLYDAAIAVSGRLAGEPAARAPVAVILVDAPSLEAKELAPYPRALFGPVWAEFLDAAFAAEAKVVAFDVLFRFSGNRFKAGHDGKFLAALHGRRDQIVLGRSARSVPVAPYLAALGFDEDGLGLLELQLDGDGVVRRAVSHFTAEDGERAPTLATSALKRFGIDNPPARLRLAPARHLTSIPHFSLIDILRCAKTAPERVRKALQGRLLIVGTGLLEEDRKLSAGRFLPRPDGAGETLADCGGRKPDAAAPFAATVPGVFLHAEIAREVIAGRLVRPLGGVSRTGIVALAAAAGAAIGIFAALSVVALPLAIGVFGLFGLEVWLLRHDLWLAGTAPISALVLGAIAAYLVRYLLEDRRRRRIENAFGHFLAPAIVSELAESDAPLALGGEAGDITVMFADLSGFTALSTRVSAEELVEVTNGYLARVSDAIEASGGYVDKFIGDAVMAFWGVPGRDENHAVHAVAAALAIRADIVAALEAAQRSGKTAYDIKVGLFSGPAVVGMMGAPRRLNYTAVGEPVNVASRLESIPPLYGVRVVLGDSTANAVASAFFLRELDTITVKGRDVPLTIYEPLAPLDDVPRAARDLASAYADALAHYRRGDFGKAQTLWRQLADADPASARMAERCGALIGQPQQDGWDGIWRLSEK